VPAGKLVDRDTAIHSSDSPAQPVGKGSQIQLFAGTNGSGIEMHSKWTFLPKTLANQKSNQAE